MMKKIVFTMTMVLILATVTACTGSKVEDAISPEPEVGGGLRTAAVIFDRSYGSAEGDLQYETLSAYEDIPVEDIIDGLSSWSGLDFKVTLSNHEENGVIVDWAADSTLVAGLDDREQKEDFFFFDQESLRWFMMDSMYRTLQEALHEEVYYTMDGGKELIFDELYPVNVFPSDIPYMGSAFYFAHEDGQGDESEDRIYFDKENMLELSYPNSFSEEAIPTDNGGVSFASLQDNTRLEYWAMTEPEDDFLDRYNAKNVVEYGYGITIATVDSMDQETGKYTYGAYLWIVDPEKYFEFESVSDYVTVAVICDTAKEAERWYGLLKEEAVYISSANGRDMGEESVN